MNTSELKAIAGQLACPNGTDGTAVGEKMNTVNGFITARCVETLRPASGQVIAEIGPGNGALSESLIDLLGSDGRYHAIERSADMANITHRRLAGRQAARVKVHCSDCADAAIDDQSLDGVFAVNLLYFIDDLGTFLSRLRGWLKPDGRVVFGVRSTASLRAMPFTEYGFAVRPLEDIIAALNTAGFVAIQVDYHDEGRVDFGGVEMPVDALIISANSAIQDGPHHR